MPTNQRPPADEPAPGPLTEINATDGVFDGDTWAVLLPDAEATLDVGRVFAQHLDVPMVVALCGEIGAGKTCFAQGVGDGIGCFGAMTSPTFALVHEVDGDPPLLHADLYRLEPGELLHIGFEEQLEDWPGLALVEWADRAADVLPLDHLEVWLDRTADGGRRLRARAKGPRADRVLFAWAKAWGDRRSVPR